MIELLSIVPVYRQTIRSVQSRCKKCRSTTCTYVLRVEPWLGHRRLQRRCKGSDDSRDCEKHTQMTRVVSLCGLAHSIYTPTPTTQTLLLFFPPISAVQNNETTLLMSSSTPET
jgi:hypothetical protein